MVLSTSLPGQGLGVDPIQPKCLNYIFFLKKLKTMSFSEKQYGVFQ